MPTQYPESRPSQDWTSKRAALILAERIVEGWRNKGWDPPNVWVETDQLNMKFIYVIRSDMVNGLPRRKKPEDESNLIRFPRRKAQPDLGVQHAGNS